MPLVRITQQDVRTPEETRQMADLVQDVMLELFAAPPGDRYQIVETLPVGSIIAEDTGLGLERSDGVVIIHITQQGRGEAKTQNRRKGHLKARHGVLYHCGYPYIPAQQNGPQRPADGQTGHKATPARSVMEWTGVSL